MHILIQHPHGAGKISGVLTYVKHLTKDLTQQGITSEVLSTESHNIFAWIAAIQRADQVYANSNHLGFILLAKLLGKPVILKYHYPIYHKILAIHGEQWQRSHPGFWNSLREEIYLLLTWQWRSPRWFIYDLTQILRLFVIIGCSLIVDERWACSNALRDHCQLPKLVKTVYNPFVPDPDLDVGKPAPPRTTIVYTGRLAYEKGVDILLQAIALLKEKHRDIPRVRILGDGPERENLIQLSKDLGLREQVDFLGRVDSEVVRREMKGAIAVVVPSRYFDAAPYVVWEATSAGAQVMASDCGGLPELVIGSRQVFATNSDFKLACLLRSIGTANEKANCTGVLR